MPAMLRPNGKAKKIAYAILGAPQNEMKHPKRLRKIKQKIEYEETRLVR